MCEVINLFAAKIGRQTKQFQPIRLTVLKHQMMMKESSFVHIIDRNENLDND